MGDRKPSQFLRHLRSHAPDIPDYLLHILWTSRLPTNIQTTFVGLDAAALCTDHSNEAVYLSTIAIISHTPDNAELLKCIGDVSRQLANLTAKRNRPNSKDLRSRSSTRQFNFSNRRSNSRSSSTHRSPSRHDTANAYCWYHQRSRDQAQVVPSPAPTTDRPPDKMLQLKEALHIFYIHP
jgi:hypothetical protein